MLKRIVFVFFTIILLGAKVAAAQPPTLESASDVASQLAKFTLEAQANGEVSIIVGFSTPLDGQELSAQAVESQEAAIQSARAAVVTSLAGTNTQIDANSLNWVIPYVAMTVDEAGLQALAENPAITSIERNDVLYNALAASVPVVQAPNVWTRGFTGTGQSVVVIDSGVERTHPFFGNRVVWEACFSGGGNSALSLCPNGGLSLTGANASSPSVCVNRGLTDCSHGTHVAGIVAGSNATVNGVAPNANIIGINASTFTNAGGRTTYFENDLISSLNHVFNIRGSFSIAAVNMSLGGGQFTTYCDAQEPALRDAFNLLRSVQIPVVVATGNNGWTGSIGSPACHSSVISVSATDNSDQRADFANVHDIMTMYAPGVGINSSILNSGYEPQDGTSMATPHVAGAVALLKQAKPSMTVTELIYALNRTGPVIDGLNKRRLDVNAALDWVLSQMVISNDFNSGSAGWGIFPANAMVTRINGGVYEFYANSTGAALLQATGRAVPANVNIEAEFLIGNSSAIRRRLTILVHDQDFSDLQVCTFWLPANMPLRSYGMLVKTTEAWSNAMISFYPAQTGSAWLRVDNVMMRNAGTGSATAETECYDSFQYPSTGQPDSNTLIGNGDFSAPITPGNPNGNWTTFGPIVYQQSGGNFKFNRQGGASGGVVFQQSGSPIPANTIVEATFTMQNTGTTRMRFTVLLHNANFNDLNVCTFWLAPGEGPVSYSMYIPTTQPWANATISFYPSRTAVNGWLVLDDVSLRSRGTLATSGTLCYPFTVGAGASEAAIIAPTLEPTATPALPAGELPLLPTSMPEGMEAAESIQQEGMIGE